MRLGWLLLVAGCQAAVQPATGVQPPGADEAWDRCLAACQAAFERRPEGPTCGPDVQGCAGTCAARVKPASPACGQCIVDHIERWPGHCGDWECVCDRVSVGSYDSCLPQCTAEKSAADAREDADYQEKLRGPRPAVTGQRPEAVLGIDGFESASGAALDPDGRLWMLGSRSRRDENSRSVLAVLDRSLSIERTRELDELRPGGAGELALSDGGAWLLGGDSDRVLTVARLGRDGSIARLRDEPMPGSYWPAVRLRALPDGRLLMMGANLGLSVFDGAGQLVWRGSLAPSNAPPVDVVVAADGDWIVAQSDGTVLVRKLRPVRDEAGAVRLRELWSRRLPAIGQSFPKALALAPSGDVLVVGELGVRSAFRVPFVARVDGDGQVLWTWTAPGPLVGGDLAAVAVTRSGAIIAAGHLDRTETYPQDDAFPVCPPEQTYCNALYVVKLNGDGTLAWEYQHRSHHSEASAALVDDRDRPLVLGWIDGIVTAADGLAVRRGLSVLRFAP